MASFEGKRAKVIDKFNGENFNLKKFKIEMLLASLDIRKIMEGIEESLFSNVDLKVKIEYQKCIYIVTSAIRFNLIDSQLWHIKFCKRSTEAWNKLCNIYESKNLSNIYFIWHKFFVAKMQVIKDLLDHINKVKILVKQLACLEVPMKDENVIMIFLASLLSSFDNFITILETISIKKFNIEFMIMQLMHEMAKRKEKESWGEDIAIVSHQDKDDNPFTCKDIKTCYYCGKLGHIVCFCFNAKKKDKNAKNAKDNDNNYIFAA